MAGAVRVAAAPAETAKAAPVSHRFEVMLFMVVPPALGDAAVAVVRSVTGGAALSP
jgi:hypothetical protein